MLFQRCKAFLASFLAMGEPFGAGFCAAGLGGGVESLGGAGLDCRWPRCPLPLWGVLPPRSALDSQLTMGAKGTLVKKDQSALRRV
jgi:hypothetical protein